MPGRRAALRTAAAGTLLVGLVALASLRFDGRPPDPPGLATAWDGEARTAVTDAAGVADCAPTPFLTPDGDSVPEAATLHLNANSYRRALVCEPSLLTLRAEGSAVDGVGARLVVAWGDRTLFDEPVESERDVRVDVPGAGWVVLSFANDLYRPPLDRNLSVSDLLLTPGTAGPP